MCGWDGVLHNPLWDALCANQERVRAGILGVAHRCIIRNRNGDHSVEATADRYVHSNAHMMNHLACDAHERVQTSLECTLM